MNLMARPRKFKTVEEMQIKIDEYFQMCDEKTETKIDDKGRAKTFYEPYTISGLCLALDIDRSTLIEYAAIPEFSNTIKKAKLKVESWVEKKAMTGDANATFAIFSLKNNFGWKDKQEVEVADKTKESFEAFLEENKHLFNNDKS